MIFWGICIVVGDGAGIADFERLGFGFPRVATSGPDQGSNYDRAVQMVMNSVTAAVLRDAVLTRSKTTG